MNPTVLNYAVIVLREILQDPRGTVWTILSTALPRLLHGDKFASTEAGQSLNFTR